MLRCKVRLQVPTPKGSVFKDLDRQSDIILRAGARAWVRAMVEAIPVWAGTARGTLRPLGRFVDQTVPISPVSSRTSTNSKALNAEGIFALGPGAGESYSDFQFVAKFPTYFFEFDERLPYVIWNNFGQPLPQVRSAPWHAFEKARSAAEAEIRKQLIAKLSDAWVNFLGAKVING